MKTSAINIILICTCVIIFAFIASIICLNRASDQMVGITIKSFLIPVIAGAGLLFIEFMKPIESFEKNLHLGFANDPKVMMQLSKGHGGELHQGILDYALLINKIGNDNLTLDNSKEKMDFIQSYLINSLITRYNNNWQSVYEKENWFFDSGSSIMHNETENNKKQKIVINNLKVQIDNKYLNKFEDNDIFYLPEGSKIELNKSANEIINISTKNITISIIGESKMTALSYDGSKTASKILKELNLERSDENNIKFYGFNLKYKVTVNKLRRWSPDTLKQLEWAKGFAEYLDDRMGWENFTNSF